MGIRACKRAYLAWRYTAARHRESVFEVRQPVCPVSYAAAFKLKILRHNQVLYNCDFLQLYDAIDKSVLYMTPY